MPEVGDYTVTNAINAVITTSYHESGSPITVNEPGITYDSTGATWKVIDPIPGYMTASGFQFWSNRFHQNFELVELLDRETNTWRVIFPETEIAEREIEAAIDEAELEAEFTQYELNRPFLFRERWYVVMGIDEYSTNYNSHMFLGEPIFVENQVWNCEYEGADFRTGARVRTSLFGSETAFRIDWIEPEEDWNDSEPDYYDDTNYSEETEDVDAREIAPILHTNVGREIPMISFEQEFSGDGDKVATVLYNAGFATNRYSEAYHNAEGRYETNNGGICYVETDSSCGYELIFDRVNLKDREEAEKIAQIQTILKQLKDDGSIRLNARCGFHTHIDVSNWGMKEIVSGYHLWNYIEDTSFRFASAFWATHRDEEVGGGYSTPVPKGHLGRRDIGRILTDRRDALNFSPILRARGNCSCNATFYEDWENCTCNVRQPTLEFRVFNATLNQRKIKAYLAFCVAFVNVVKTRDFVPDAFPEMRWQGTSRKSSVFVAGNTSQTWQEATLERIKFIMSEFPLTNSEKGDIMYCMRNSSLDEVLELL